MTEPDTSLIEEMNEVSCYMCRDCIYSIYKFPYGKCRAFKPGRIDAYRPWFVTSIGDIPDCHPICKYFECNPTYIEKYIEWHKYKGYWDYREKYAAQDWIRKSNKPSYLAFFINGNRDVAYYVNSKHFINASLETKDGILKCKYKQYYVRHKKKHELDFPYKLVTEETPGGVKIDV